MEKTALPKQNHFDHNADVHKQGSKRHIMCHKKGSKKGDDAADRHDPVERQDKSCCRRNPLSAAKSEIERIIVSQDRSCCRIELKQRQNIRMCFAKYDSDQHHCQDTFSTVPGKRQKTCFEPHGTQHIGRTGIVASVFPDIDPMCFS